MLDATPFAWRAAKLGSVAEITTGGTPPRAVREFWGGVLPWVTTAEVDFGTILSTAEQITRAGLSNSSARMYPVGALLVALYGQGRTRGRVARLGIAASCNQACAALQVNEEVSGDYLFHWLSGQYETLRALSNSGGQENLSLTILREVEVAIPPLEEQRAIAAALNDVDALIAALDALIAKKRDIKQATMQQLLTGKTRLPGFSGAWETLPLGQAGLWMSGGTPSKARLEFWNGSIPWVSAKDMKAARLWDSEDHVSPEAIGRGTRQVQRGAILVVVRGMILAHSVPVAMAMTALCFNQDLKALVVESPIHGEFVFWWLVANERLLLDVTSLSSHGTKRIPMESLKLVPLPLPPLAEQRAIAEVLTDLDAELAALDARREKTRLIKQGMMQALLTGQVRLV